MGHVSAPTISFNTPSAENSPARTSLQQPQNTFQHRAIVPSMDGQHLEYRGSRLAPGCSPWSISWALTNHSYEDSHARSRLRHAPLSVDAVRRANCASSIVDTQPNKAKQNG